MMELGRICVKTCGRDAGKKCVIVDVIDDNFVIIDGETRRRKCNVKHIEPTKESVKLAKGADHGVVVAEFKKMGIELKETKPKKTTEKPKQVRAADRKKMAEKETPKKKAPAKKSDKTENTEETKLEKELSEPKSEEEKKE